jgi:uncharacterized tellurite resistance protein B-like protein
MGGQADTEVVRRIASRLERLDSEKARYVAAFAAVLTRVAHADLRITETETGAMKDALERVAGLGDEEADLAVEIARTLASEFGGTENYLATREFRAISDRTQRTQLLHSLYAVAAADELISPEESAEIRRIAEELGFAPEELTPIRAQYREHLSEFKRAT